VAAAVADTMKGLDLHFPTIDRDKRKDLTAAEAALRRKGA
jgi:hypothetical protein